MPFLIHSTIDLMSQLKYFWIFWLIYGNAVFHFIGALNPSFEVQSSLRANRNIEVHYHGRLPKFRTMEILSLSDVYWSATSLATQNLGLCEALAMNKLIYISKIKAHVEIGNLAGLPNNCYFYPLGKINLNQKFAKGKASLNFLKFEYFSNQIKKIFNDLWRYQKANKE